LADCDCYNYYSFLLIGLLATENMFITFLIIALSFTAGLWIGTKIPKDTVEGIAKKAIKKVKKSDAGVVRGMTPKEEKQMKDQEFREAFPQLG